MGTTDWYYLPRSNVAMWDQGVKVHMPFGPDLGMWSQEIIQLRLALNARRYLALHYLQQQEIGTS